MFSTGVGASGFPCGALDGEAAMLPRLAKQAGFPTTARARVRWLLAHAPPETLAGLRAGDLSIEGIYKALG
jgi:hypothetical protein